MATPRKLNVMFCFPSYGGNGGISSEVPDIRQWYTDIRLNIERDERIDKVFELTVGDTPVTMVRNRFVVEGRRVGADVLVMVDSDMHPWKHRGQPGWKEFFTTSFDFLYDHYEKGPVVIGAPYCGSPEAGENMFVFYWENHGVYADEMDVECSIEMYPREVARRMAGIQECAALPTGMIMYDIRAFQLIEPLTLRHDEIVDLLVEGNISRDDAIRALSQGWFYYEWKDGTACEKASTEDVTNTRDISLAGQVKLGYNPVFCNWDSPVGHWKPWCVEGKPRQYVVEQIGAAFQRAVLEKRSGREQIIEFDSGLGDVQLVKEEDRDAV